MLLSFSVSAQVIIKERVEINPQTINPEYQISQFDPCPNITRPQYHQSVYSYSGFPVEPYQQLYPFQSGTDSTKLISTALYNAEIITGTDYAYFERIEYIDSSGNTYPSETFGSLLTGLTGAELSGTGNYIGIEHTGTFERENSTVYRIKFNNYSEPEATVIVRITNLNTNTYTDWHTLIVNPDLRLVNQQYEADTLLHYYSKDVTPRLVNANYPCNHPGFGGCPPENVTFNIEIIEGQQYGRIKNELTEELSTSFTGIAFSELYLFTYYANGNQPDSTATVRIRHSSNDAEITPMEFSFTIKRNTIPPPSEGGSIYVKMNKKVVAPGDTVNVQLRWVDEVGDTIDFLPIQRFRVGLAEGSQYGRILDIQTGDTADTFTEIGNEFKVISSAEIEPSQVKIILVAEADLMIFTRPVRINNGTMKTKKLEENTVDKNDEQGGTNTDLIIIGNHLVGVGEITITKTPFVVEIIPSRVSPGDTAQIIPMKLNPDGTTSPFDSLQTFELGMIEGCDAGLILNNGAMENYFAEVYQPIYFVAANDLTETDTVMVRVGLIEGGGSSRPVNTGGEKTDAIITNLNKNKKEPELLPMNPSTYCFPENFWTPHDLEGIANLVVGDECDNLPTEQQEISYTLLEQPEFFIVPHSDLEELKLVELIQVCNDTAHPNQNGGSIPVEYKRYRYDYTTNSFKISWVLEPYKGIDGYVHYYFKNQQSNQSTSILFDYVKGVCYTKINKPWLTLIENISDIDEPTKIPSSDDKQAFKDFCGHLCYPNERATYVLVEIIQIHESEHMNDFEEIISRSFPKLAQKIEDHKDLCESYDETVRINAEKVIYDMIENFIDEAISEFQAKSGEPNSETELNNERKIQGRPSITNRIEDYKNALKNRFSILKDEVCQKCSYEEQN